MDWIFGTAATAEAVVVFTECKKQQHGTRHMNWQIIMSFWKWLLDLMHGHWFSSWKKKRFSSHQICFVHSNWKWNSRFDRQMTTHINHKQHSQIKISREKKSLNALVNEKKKNKKNEVCNLHKRIANHISFRNHMV